MSRLALDPTNLLVATTNPTTPTIRTGDMYINSTDNSLRFYNGSTWISLTSATTLSALDAGFFDSISPYDGGTATTTSTQTVDGGSA